VRIKTEDLWDGLHAIDSEDGTATKIALSVLAKLVELKIVELKATNLPQPTDYGHKAYTVIESGGSSVPELGRSCRSRISCGQLNRAELIATTLAPTPRVQWKLGRTMFLALAAMCV
jgi:hypothetical protein